MSDSKVEKVSVALYPIDQKIVTRVRQKHGLNFSSALRMIVRDWDEHNAHIGRPRRHHRQPVTGEITAVITDRKA